MMLATTAQAEEPPTLDELALELAYDHCPRILTGEQRIDAAEVNALGFGGTETKAHARAGEIQMRKLQVGEDELMLATATEASLCQVGIQGASGRRVLDMLLSGLSALDYEFEHDLANSFDRESVSVITKTAALEDGARLSVQFIHASDSADQFAAIQFTVLED